VFELVDDLRGGRTRQPDVVGCLREAATLDHAREQPHRFKSVHEFGPWLLFEKIEQ